MSNGRAGEEAARYAFNRLGWTMFKTNPAVKNLGPLKQPGQFRAVYVEGGVPDFIGHRRSDGQARYCEVKEATPSEGESVGHSRLSDEQRAFMEGLPAEYTFVGILWRDGAFELFRFAAGRGSYKKGCGLN